MQALWTFLRAVLAIAAPIGTAHLTARLRIEPPWAYLLIGVGPLVLFLWCVRSAVAVIGGPTSPIRKVLEVGFVMLLAVVVAGGLQLFGMMVHAVAGKAAISARKAVCMSNVKSLTLAALLYAAEHEGRLPAAETWCDDLLPYIQDEDMFLCPAAPDLRCAYAYNAALSEVDRESIADPVNVVLIYESDGGWNAAGGMELLAAEPRHLGGDDYGFADGHARWMMRKYVATGSEGQRSYEKRPADDWVRWDVALPAE